MARKPRTVSTETLEEQIEMFPIETEDAAEPEITPEVTTPVVQPVSAQTLMEIEAGRRALEQFKN